MPTSVQHTRFEDLPHECKWFSRGCVHCQDHARMRVHAERAALQAENDRLLTALRDIEACVPTLGENWATALVHNALNPTEETT